MPMLGVHKRNQPENLVANAPESLLLRTLGIYMTQSFIFELDEDIGQFKVYINDKNGRVGYLNYYLNNQSLEIVDVLLDNVYRQKGIGSELINLVINLAKSKKCESIILVTAEHDLLVHGFYIKHGFHLTGINNNRGALFKLNLA
jgi:ribosomal protein S18 acetylase RimI-like enzyme